MTASYQKLYVLLGGPYMRSSRCRHARRQQNLSWRIEGFELASVSAHHLLDLRPFVSLVVPCPVTSVSLLRPSETTLKSWKISAQGAPIPLMWVMGLAGHADGWCLSVAAPECSLYSLHLSCF